MKASDWTIDRRAATWRITSRLLAQVSGVGHGFSTRREGDAADDFDLGGARAPSDRERARRRALCKAAGLGDREPVVLEQVHGAVVVDARSVAGPEEVETGDAIFSAGAADVVPIAVRTADCAPVLVVEDGGAAVAAIHAGWRGAAAGVVHGTFATLVGNGIAPSRLRAAVGPTIGPCCYEVGPEVLEAVAARTEVTPDRISRRTGTGRPALALAAAIARQVVAAGVPRDRVSVAPWCTACEPTLFFSYRRDGRLAGRMMAVVGRTGCVP